MVDERLFYTESTATKPARLNCQFCHTVEDKMQCRNPRCRRTFEVSGIRTTATL